MKLLLIAVLVIISIYPLSYAKYNWDKKNKFQAVGCILLVLISVVTSIMVLWK